MAGIQGRRPLNNAADGNSQIPTPKSQVPSPKQEFFYFWDLGVGNWELTRLLCSVSYRIIPDVMIMSTMRPIGAGGRTRKNTWNETGLFPCVGRSTAGTL